MSVRVNTNVDAFDAQRNLGLVSSDFSNAVRQLSSGLRINSAADDAAGLAISEKLQGQVNGFDQAGRNAQDAISMVQTGESALGTIQDVLQRMRQLAVQASNDTYTASDRANIQTEVGQLVAEIDRISSQTDFNTKKLLDGSAGGAQVFGGGPTVSGIVAMAGVALATTFSITAATEATRSAAEAAQAAQGSTFTQTSTLTITGGLGTQTFTAQKGESLETFFQTVDNSGIGVSAQIDSQTGAMEIVNNNFGINTAQQDASGNALHSVTPAGPTHVTVNGVSFTSNTIFTGGASAVTVSGVSGDFGTTGLDMEWATGTAGAVTSDGTYTAGQAVSNASITLVFANGKSQVLTATGINSDVVYGSSTASGLVFTLASPIPISPTAGDKFTVVQNSSGATQFQVGANAHQTVSLSLDAVNSQTLGVGAMDVLTQSDASSAITQLDRAIQYVSTARANMGAIINRLTDSVNNDQSAQENAMAAESRIRDVNVASETVQFTRDQILMQAGTAVLAQANQENATLLQLLH